MCSPKPPENFRRVRLGSIRNKNSNASKRLIVWEIFSFRIPGFPFPLFCSQEQNSRNILRNIFLFRNIPNKRALGRHVVLGISFSSPLLTSARYQKHCGMFGPKMCFFFSNSYFQSKRKTSTIFQVPYSSASFIFSSPTLCLAKQAALICGANEVSSHLQTTRKIELTLIMNTEMINNNKKTCLGNIQNTNQPF